MIYRACTLIGISLLVVLAGCRSTGEAVSPEDLPADAQATEETRALYLNLKQVAREHVLFGHQDDLAYGVEWWAEPGRSDVKEVAGSYPAVYGWEIGDIGTPGAETNLDDVDFDKMRGWIEEGYERGGVITISWHMDNLVSGGDTWDTTRAVHALVPGGTHHEAFKDMLDQFAAFAKSLKVGTWSWLGFGDHVPVIFRPFHEHTGSWFWWGKELSSPEDYKALWRFTVDYLRDEKDVHNLLYAYSPSFLDDPEEFWERYPGDDYVDIFGVDAYYSPQWGFGGGGVEPLTDLLSWLVRQAEERGKVAALTETGYEGIPDSTWWTGTLLDAFDDPTARGIAYVLVWRNANAERDRPGHFYAPYPGHPSAPNFVRFTDDPLIYLEDDLPDMYEMP